MARTRKWPIGFGAAVVPKRDSTEIFVEKLYCALLLGLCLHVG